jgi:transposase
MKGRPSAYKPDFCERVIKLGRQGKSFHQISAVLGVCFVTLNAWREKYPEFQAALTRSRDLAQAWWENEGQKGIWSRDFNAQAYRLQMLNRFPESWRDTQRLEHSGPNGGPIRTSESVTVEDFEKELMALGALDKNGKLIPAK